MLDRILYFIKDIIIGAIEKSLQFTRKNKVFLNQTSKKVLIIKIDGIGDFVIFLPFLEFLRNYFKNQEISLIVTPEVRELAELSPYIDKIIVFERMKYAFNLLYRYSFLKKIANNYYTTVLYSVYSRDEHGDEIVRFANAYEKIGFEGNDLNIKHWRKIKHNIFFTKLIQSDKKCKHEIERNHDFVKSFTSVPERPFTKSVVWFSEADNLVAAKLLQENSIISDEKIVIICPSARYNLRKWDYKKFISLIRKLIEYYNVRIMLCGSTNDMRLIHKIKKEIANNIIDLSGKTSLRVLVALLKKSKLFIGNETGIAHLAAAVGTPSIVIMGGGHFTRFFPLGEHVTTIYNRMNCFDCDWHCIYNEPKCITSITVEEILQAVQKYL